MNRSSIYKLKIDFDRSRGSFLFDKKSETKYLDFFGQYSTLTLGYNHPAFWGLPFQNEINRVVRQKTTNCEILSDEAQEFHEMFKKFTSCGVFTDYHYSCTGALAIEAAIKAAIYYRNNYTKRMLVFNNSFHGINGYGGLITDRVGSVYKRLSGFPQFDWGYQESPTMEYINGNPVADKNKIMSSLQQIEIELKYGYAAGVLMEPIQSTAGDLYYPPEFLIAVRELTLKHDVPLIFDEIQTGFGMTGKVWYFQHLPIIPDIIVFGKKTQLSGIAVQEKFNKIFSEPVRLEVTWDADIIDMIRCKYIIGAFENYDILYNVKKRSSEFVDGLKEINKFQNIRNCGLLVAFDLENRGQRDKFNKLLFENHMLCNPSQEKTIRFRPNLCVTQKEIELALEILNKVAKKI